MSGHELWTEQPRVLVDLALAAGRVSVGREK